MRLFKGNINVVSCQTDNLYRYIYDVYAVL